MDDTLGMVSEVQTRSLGICEQLIDVIKETDMLI